MEKEENEEAEEKEEEDEVQVQVDRLWEDSRQLSCGFRFVLIDDLCNFDNLQSDISTCNEPLFQNWINQVPSADLSSASRLT